LENFALAIKKAKAEAPNFVRLADGKCFEFADKPIGDGMGKPIINSNDFKTQMENWKLELDQLFGEGDLGFFGLIDFIRVFVIDAKHFDKDLSKWIRVTMIYHSPQSTLIY